VFATISFLLPIVLVAQTNAEPLPSRPFEDAALANAVWQSAPAIADARKALALAQGDAAQAKLLPNPALMATWGTIPLGSRNPSSSAVSFWDVPNYTVGLSQNVELGKRGPRQAAMNAFARAQQQQVMDVYRRTFFDVLDTMVEQAAAAVSTREFEQLVADSAASLALQQARADKGDTAGLDVDRLSVEHERLISARDEHLVAQEAALGNCAALLGGPCPKFASAEQAAAYLERGIGTVMLNTTDWQEKRPDLKALQAQAQGMQDLETLAQRRRIPDPTVSVGYTKDTFLVSGNQGQSVSVSVSLPLPVFDRGQVATRTVVEQRRATEDTMTAVTRGSTVELEHARLQLELARHRVDHLQNKVLPRAQNVLERLQAAAARGGVPLQEVLLARRTLEDLRLERVDVVAHANHLWLNIRLLNADTPTIAMPENKSAGSPGSP
jgi:outer membrane protein, heavy metal efflux system